MCAIVGAIINLPSPLYHTAQIDAALTALMQTGMRRGRDGRGYQIFHNGGSRHERSTERLDHAQFNIQITESKNQTFIGNLRAEPTTEFVDNKQIDDQQPYQLGDWSIVHNGTIANDKDLRTNEYPSTIDSATIVEQLKKESLGEQDVYSDKYAAFRHFRDVVKRLKGSYAILAMHKAYPGVIFTACNYRPIWINRDKHATYFSSTRYMYGIAEMLQPYNVYMFYYNATGQLKHNCWSIMSGSPNKKALVVCSGGLDSVVAATEMKRKNYDIHLIHFMYGSRAEGPEVQAVTNVAEYLSVPVTFFPLPVYKPSDSPLLDSNSALAGGEQGAEFAHEWVPARNLLLLSVATAFAESNGYQTIVLGNNLEEAGAYPDNEPEFIAKFNDLLPFAVGDGKRMYVEQPVGNLMKHEIVAMGLANRAPMHLTWSCYRAGAIHCGKCGPCYMRRKAFQINKAADPMSYAAEF